MASTPRPFASPIRRRRGFEPAVGLMTEQIRKATETRGFAVARLLTHWAEIAGTAMAGITRPVKVGYGREGMGATLTLLVNAAHAPMVQMELPRLKERVNAVYGYGAIVRIVLTQTAASGFADGQAQFLAAPKAVVLPDAAATEAARAAAAPIQDESLRRALAALGQNILTKRP